MGSVILALLSLCCASYFCSLIGVHDFTGFENCHYLVYEFEFVEANLTHIPVIRYRVSNPNNHDGLGRTVDLGRKLLQSWALQKLNLVCQLIFIIRPPHMHFDLGYSFLWLMDCFDGNRCYGKNIYYIHVGQSSFVPVNRWSPLHRIPQYEYISTNNSDRLLVHLTHPCKIDIEMELNFDASRKFSRKFLDEIYSDLLLSCTLTWAFVEPSEKFSTGPNSTALVTLDGSRALLVDIVQVLNARTISKNKKYSIQNTKPENSINVNPRIYPTKVLYPERKDRLSNYRFYTSEVRYNFITCDGATEYVSFLAFLKPFHSSIWICTSLTLLLMGTYMKVHGVKIRAADCVSLLITRIVLKQGYSLSLKFRKVIGFQILLCAFCILFLIPTALYESYLTADLTNPFPVKRLKSIEEAMGNAYSIFLPIPNYLRPFLGTFESGERVGSIWKVVQVLRQRSQFLDNFMSDQSTAAAEYFPKNELRFKIYKSFRVNISKDYEAENELRQCNKTIMVVENKFLGKVLQGIIEKYERPSEFYVGQDAFMAHPVVFKIAPTEWDRFYVIYNRFQSLLHSGIFKHAEILEVGRNIQGINGNLVEALTMSSNFVLSTYIIYFVLKICCLILFLAEVMLKPSDSTVVSKY